MYEFPCNTINLIIVTIIIITIHVNLYRWHCTYNQYCILERVIWWEILQVGSCNSSSVAVKCFIFQNALSQHGESVKSF